jgi:polyisoprenoid-binding protein YceI
MTTTHESGRQEPIRNPSSGSPRKHHWLRWTLVGVLVLVVAGGFFSVQSLAGPVTPALVLPRVGPTPAGAASSSIDGTWTVVKGSSAGYRVPEVFLWQHSTLVARTTAVTGKFVIARTEVSSATLRVDLSTVTAGGKKPSGLAGILDTASHPDAVFTLTKPIIIGSAPAINATFNASATGLLAMHGTTQLVTFAIAARYAGSQLAAAGSIPIVFSDWNIKAPFAVQDHGSAEFLLLMHR